MEDCMFISTPPQPPPKPITIWIHGTRPSSVLPFLATHHKVQQLVDASVQSSKGLRPFYELNPEGKTYRLLHALSASNPDSFPEDSLYSFGWSGDFNIAARKQAAQDLLESITKLIGEQKKIYGTTPQITLISHSHGGNVILYMASLFETEALFSIKRAILLATPVQKETSHLIGHSLFETLYSIHSHGDMIQVMDPQRLHPYKTAFAQWQQTKSFESIKNAYFEGLAQPFFSERHFPMAHNLIQADVCWKFITPSPVGQEKPANKIESFFNKIARSIVNHKRGVLHTEFITPSFMRHLPDILTQLDEHILAHGPTSRDIEIVI